MPASEVIRDAESSLHPLRPHTLCQTGRLPGSKAGWIHDQRSSSARIARSSKGRSYRRSIVPREASSPAGDKSVTHGAQHSTARPASPAIGPTRDGLTSSVRGAASRIGSEGGRLASRGGPERYTDAPSRLRATLPQGHHTSPRPVTRGRPFEETWRVRRRGWRRDTRGWKRNAPSRTDQLETRRFACLGRSTLRSAFLCCFQPLGSAVRSHDAKRTNAREDFARGRSSPL